MELNDKVALVTGGARRVGRAIALELARAGCDVAVHYHTSQEQARELVSIIQNTGRRAWCFPADLARLDEIPLLVSAVTQAAGRIDVLVNNAAVFRPDTPESFESRAALDQTTVNLLAPMALAVACWPLFQRQTCGKIINVTDARIDQPMSGYMSYTSGKAGLAGLTRWLARWMAPVVQVNAVAPGVAVFPEDLDQETRAQVIGRVPAARPGTPEEIARVVRFLAAEADFVTGQIWRVDGGRSLV